MIEATTSRRRFNYNVIQRDRPLNRAIMALLAFALLLLLAVNVASYVMSQRTAAYNQVVAQSKFIQLEGLEMVSLLTDAETGQRGYMLTAEPSYLAIYTHALQRLPDVMDSLAERVKDSPEQQARLEKVRQDFELRRTLMIETIELTRTGRIGEAVSLVRSGKGKVLMNDMREQIRMMGIYEERRIETLTRSSERAQAYTIAFNSIGGLLVLVLAVISVLLVTRQVNTLMAAQEALDRANADLEEEVKVRTADLVQANEEIQRFAYIVSHDLRAPLVNVMGYTSELERVGHMLDAQLVKLEQTHPELVNAEAAQAVREDVPEAVGFIRASTAKMDNLIKAILNLSREGRRTLVREPLDMTSLVQGLANAVAHPIIDSGGSIEIHDLPQIESDRLSIEQIFGNLIDNAAKYRQPEQPLHLVVKGHELEGDWVEYEICDNGRGIAPKDHERIFELFRRSGKQDQPGEGLGLAFVRSAIRRLGGSIDLDSELGKGATFKVRFPRKMPVRPD